MVYRVSAQRLEGDSNREAEMGVNRVNLPGISRLICVASKEYPRYSEGDVTLLCDGRLLLALARKNGSSDFAKGELIGFFSRDRGLTWDDQPHVIQGPFDDVGDLMSVSFCRSAR